VTLDPASGVYRPAAPDAPDAVDESPATIIVCVTVPVPALPVAEEPARGVNRPTAPLAALAVAEDPATIIFSATVPEPALAVDELPATGVNRPIVPDAALAVEEDPVRTIFSTTEPEPAEAVVLDPDIAAVADTEPLAELGVAERPLTAARRLIAPLALDAVALEPDRISGMNVMTPISKNVPLTVFALNVCELADGALRYALVIIVAVLKFSIRVQLRLVGSVDPDWLMPPIHTSPVVVSAPVAADIDVTPLLPVPAGFLSLVHTPGIPTIVARIC
jgi:hypothetical protein